MRSRDVEIGKPVQFTLRSRLRTGTILGWHSPRRKLVMVNGDGNFRKPLLFTVNQLKEVK